MQIKLELEEIWKDIKGYEGYYQISNLGRVKRLSSGRMIAIAVKSNGYMMFQTCVKGKCNIYTLHRQLAIAFIPRIKGMDIVNHIDENILNNNLSNLEWTDRSGNAVHSIKRKANEGKYMPQCVLTKEKVIGIRSKYVPRVYTYKMLAKEYGVTLKIIESVLRRKTYKWVE